MITARTQRRRATATIAAMIAGVAVATTVVAPPARAAATVERAAGEDRIATAIEISQLAFPSADTAVIVNQSAFADALAAAPLAAANGAPILLTRGDRLDDRVAAELDRLDVSRVLLMGGTAVMSAAVQDELDDHWTVERIGGDDRFDTARRAALAAASEWYGEIAAPEVIIALGQAADPSRAWPDALGAGVLAGHARHPILLVRGTSIPTPTRQALLELDPAKLTIIGGTSAISKVVSNELRDEGFPNVRIAGDDRFETSTRIATAARAAGAGPDVVVVASGRNFADALGAGPAAVALGGVLVLTDNIDLDRSPIVGTWLDSGDDPSRLIVAGGPGALAAGLDGQLQRAATGFVAPALSLEEVGSFDNPMMLTQATGDGRRFVITRKGLVEVILADGTQQATAYLDISSQVNSASDTEHGLLGIALHPQFATNGRYFLHFSRIDGDSVIAEYHQSATNPARSEPTGRVLLTVDQPATNHNGGSLEFGPDGMLYLFLGDGGGSGDPTGRAQNLDSRLGKILRMDVSTVNTAVVPSDNPYVNAPGDDLVWASGLRNPYRASFDPIRKNLWIGDVGQNRIEEIDAVSLAESRGADFGWAYAEGSLCHPDPEDCTPRDHTFPVYEYGRDVGRSVTGGFVHRGAEGMLRGHYFFGDFFGMIRSFRLGDDGLTVLEETDWTEMLDLSGNVFSFGRDAAGEVYVMNATNVYRITTG